MARRRQRPVEVIAGEVDGNESQRPCERLQLADASRLSRCEAGWSTSKTSTVASPRMRQALPSRPAPGITTWAAGRSETASSIATVRGTMTSAFARNISNSMRSRQALGAMPERASKTGPRSSSRSSRMAVGSSKRPTASRP